MISLGKPSFFKAKRYNDWCGLSGDVKPHIIGTVAFNQLISNGNFTSTTGWTAARGSMTVSDNTLTYTISDAGIGNQNRIYASVNFVSGHKYYIKATVRSSAQKQVRFLSMTPTTLTFPSQTVVEANKWTTISDIREITDDNTVVAIFLPSDNAVSDTLEIRNFMLIDLTAMYGVGNEPTDTKVVEYDCNCIGYNLDTYIPPIENAPVYDVKNPTVPYNGDRFYEIDTAKFYRYDKAGNKWYQQ